MSRVLVLFACLTAITSHSVSAQAPEKSIFYTGQLDGFAGSAVNCTPKCADQVASAFGDMRAKTKGAILVGLGDNFAPDPGAGFQAQMDVHQRLNPQFSADRFRVIDFLRNAKYDAVVPGVQDFYFGAEFVRRSEDEVKMVATNLVRVAQQPSTCPAYPQLPPTNILLPNQISSSIASGSSASAASAGGGGAGSGGGGKGKGGKKGGGTSASSAASAASSSGGAGSAAPATCLPQPDAELSKHSDPIHPAPKILWPDANSIYPWTTQIGFAKPFPPDITGLYLCTPEDPKNAPKHLDLDTCTSKLQRPVPASGTAGSGSRYLVDGGDLGVEENGLILPFTVQTRFKLLAGATGRICYTWGAPENQVNHSCATVTVQEPMFQHAWRAPEGSNYVIVGALAPDTLSGLSSIDASWYEDKHASKVARHVAVNDPTSAVLQALHAFDLLNRHTTNLYGVLLAQMPPSEAKALADNLGESFYRGSNETVVTRIDLIISAADLVESSPHATVEIVDPAQIKANPDGSYDTYFIPVFAPAPVFQKANCLAQIDSKACLSRITPKPVPAGAGGTSMVQLENYPAVTNARSGRPNAGESWTTPFCADKTAPTVAQEWECGVLQRMLKDTSANPKLGNSSDIAILEEKNFDFSRSSWRPQSATAPPTPEQAAEILWKAGRLARVSLLGSTLETLLQQNTKLQGRNFQVLPSSQSMQQLKILGITKIGEVYYINGMPLSESQTYSVATTDHLANMTSDFPQLAQLDLDNPNLFPLHKKTLQIADIALDPVARPKSPYVQLYAADDLEGPELTPEIKKKGPEPKAPSYSYSNRTLPYSDVSEAAKLEAAALVAGKQSGTGAQETRQTLPTTGEIDRQLRPLFRVTLEQTALSYSSATPNQSDPSIGANFGGVSNPNVNSAYSVSESVLQNLRVEWYPPHGRQVWFEDMGLDYLLNSAESIQGSLAAAPSTPLLTTAGIPVPERVKSLTANNITLSPFFEFQIPRFPLWKALVVREIASDNVAQPLPQYLGGCTAGSQLTFISNGSAVTKTCDAGAVKDDFQFSPRRTWTLGESVGTRFEKDDFRYAEIGFTHQRSHAVLSAVGVVNAGTNSVTYFCSLIGAQSLTICAGNLPAEAGVSLVPSYSDYSQNGGYVLGLWTVPIMKRVVLQGSGFGNFFAYGNKNQSVLTHYAFNAMLTTLVNLPANFSIGPTLNEFLFQSNATRTIGSNLIRRTIGVQLNYSFDWHTGVSAREFFGNSQ